MCRALGVSKAIIDNVLFCHQEDSSWPLGTDKELKEKFDAIFGTTEYNKGVETIRKKRRIYEAMVKDKGICLKTVEDCMVTHHGHYGYSDTQTCIPRIIK